MLVAFPKPGDEERDDVRDVRVSWRSWGFVVDVYCPGRSCTVVSEDDIVPPTLRNEPRYVSSKASTYW